MQRPKLKWNVKWMSRNKENFLLKEIANISRLSESQNLELYHIKDERSTYTRNMCIL